MAGSLARQGGAAKLSDATPASNGSVAGAPRASEIDARTDVWALGTILHEMLTGQPAFAGETLTTLLVNVLVNPSPSLRGTGVPDHVVGAIDRALAKEAAQRWPDMPSFIAALTAA